ADRRMAFVPEVFPGGDGAGTRTVAVKLQDDAYGRDFIEEKQKIFVGRGAEMRIKIRESNEYFFVNPDTIGATRAGVVGVYYFYEKFRDVIYIGKTKSFRNRFTQHSRGTYFFPHVTKIKAFPIEREVDRDIYETYFINVYHPQYNVSKKWKE